MAIPIAVIGLGTRGSQWCAELRRSPRFELVAACDPSSGARQRAVELGLPPDRIFADLHDLVARVRAHAAIVATPIDGHVTPCEQVIDAGWALLCEKPIALNLADARRLVVRAARRGVPFLAGQNYRFLRMFRAARRVLGNGEIGRLAAATLSYWREGHVVASGLDRIRGTALWETGIHHLDIVRHLTGDEIRRVTATATSPSGGPLQDTTWFISMELERGPLVSYRLSWDSCGHRAFEHGQQFTARFVGDKGTLHILQRWLVLCRQGHWPTLVRRGPRPRTEEACVLDHDRGDRVKKGQLLAEVYDPELEVAVLQAEASLQHSQALAKQAEARLKTALAGVQAAEAKRAQTASMLEEAEAQRSYRKKALDRLTELARRNAVEQRLVDEQEDQYMGSLASEHAAQSGILTADAQIAEAKAAVELARADLVTAQAEIAVSEANVKKAKVFLEYTRIEAPFNGVITFRGEGVHPGAFIRAATEGSAEPLLTVSRTDKFRTNVEIPDTDVPFCNAGDPATVRVSTLAGRVFKGKVSRVAEAEDLKNRTMRVEIDLPNPDGLLRDGMYGRALIELEPPSNNLTVPASCLIEKDRNGEGAVFVVRGGKVERIPIRVGKDSGVQVEVVSGLAENDEVISQITPSIAAGSQVKAVPANVDKQKGSPD